MVLLAEQPAGLAANKTGAQNPLMPGGPVCPVLDQALCPRPRLSFLRFLL